MEARQTLRASGAPKGLLIVLAAFAALGVAMATSVVAHDFAGSGPAVNGIVHAAPGTVLRQDNPPITTVQAAPGTVLRQDNPVKSGSPLLDRNAERQSSAPALAARPGRGSRSL